MSSARAARAGSMDESRIDAWIRSVELDRRVAGAVRLLGGELRVEDVSARLGISERQLRRIVLADVGVAPKAFQRVARLRRLLARRRAGEVSPRPPSRRATPTRRT